MPADHVPGKTRLCSFHSAAVRKLNRATSPLLALSAHPSLHTDLSEQRRQDVVYLALTLWSKLWAERTFVGTLLGIFVAIVLALLAGAGWVFSLYIDHSFASHLAPVEQRLDSLSERLAKVEGRTQVAALVHSDLDRIAKLPSSEFAKNLPFVGKVLSTAKSGDLPIPQQTVSDLKSKLVTADRSDPGFWYAAAAVIDYSAPVQAAPLPDCYNVSPASSLWKPTPGELQLLSLGPTWGHCSLDLNAAIPATIQRTIDSLSNGPWHKHVKVVCEHCQIRYSGGPVPLLEGNIKKLVLIGCAFDFTPNAKPSKSGEHVIEQLIQAADLSHVELRPKA